MVVRIKLVSAHTFTPSIGSPLLTKSVAHQTLFEERRKRPNHEFARKSTKKRAPNGQLHLPTPDESDASGLDIAGSVSQADSKPFR